MIYGNATGGFGMPKLIELTDENGNTLIGTVTDSDIDLDATRDDVKIGKKFASNDGISEGADTRTYRTICSNYLVLPNEKFEIPLSLNSQYNYTKFQAMIAKFNTTIYDSVSITQVALNDAVYNSNSNVKLADISKNSLTQSIDLNIENNTSDIYIIYYITYKEE